MFPLKHIIGTVSSKKLLSQWNNRYLFPAGLRPCWDIAFGANATKFCFEQGAMREYPYGRDRRATQCKAKFGKYSPKGKIPTWS